MCDDHVIDDTYSASDEVFDPDVTLDDIVFDDVTMATEGSTGDTPCPRDVGSSGTTDPVSLLSGVLLLWLLLIVSRSVSSYMVILLWFYMMIKGFPK